MKITIIHQRSKCIGCNYCVEQAPERWRMNKKDGKSVLIGGVEKKNFFVAQASSTEKEANEKAARVCPVHIIQVRE